MKFINAQSTFAKNNIRVSGGEAKDGQTDNDRHQELWRRDKVDSSLCPLSAS